MLIEAENSLLLVVDVQERLLPRVRDPQAVLRNLGILVRAARRLDIPVMATEQYPEGLGHTVEPLAGLLPDGCVLEKTWFSAVSDARLGDSLARSGRTHILICGTEAHVCVLQTATELQAAPGWQVFLAADATSSRTADNHRLALERLARRGVELLSTEMVVFEWLRQSDRPEFRDLLALIR